MRNAFVNTIVEVARRDRRIMILTGDLGFTVLEKFSDKYPDRYLNIGVAEANMVSLATGLSLTGFIPFVYSIASFMTLRPYEQTIRDVAQHNANVKIVGIGGGFSYSHAGPSHHAIEDIAIMSSIPNMTILCPADPIETAWATREALKINGPVYLRLGKAGEPNLLKENTSRKLGKATVVKKGKDVCIVATGTILQNVLKAVEELKKDNINPTVVHMPTMKPFDEELILKLLETHREIISVEEHRIINGLGSALANVMAVTGTTAKLTKLGIGDIFFSRSGSQEFLQKQVCIDTENIVKVVRKLY